MNPSSRSILECWLAWSCVGFVQATSGAMSWWVKWSCHIQKTLLCFGPPWSLDFIIFPPPFPLWSLSLGEGCDVDVTFLTKYPMVTYSLHFDQLVIRFRVNLHPLHKEAFLMRSESCTGLGLVHPSVHNNPHYLHFPTTTRHGSL